MSGANTSPTILGMAIVGVLIGLPTCRTTTFGLRLFLCGASLFYLNVAADLTDGQKAGLIGFAMNISTVSFLAWINERGRWAT